MLLTGPQVLMIYMVHILSDKEEEDKIEYTCITPKWTLEEEDETEEEDEKEDTHIRLLVQPTDELLGLIGDDDNIVDEAIR